MGNFNKLKNRKEEHQLREGRLAQILEAANTIKDEMKDIVVKKPWITEEEASDVTDKVDEFLGKVAGLVKEQDEAGLMVEPTFKVAKVQDDFAKVTKLYKKVAGKKKPVEKKKKKEKVEEDDAQQEGDKD